MAKYNVAVSQNQDDWLAQQRRKEKNFSLRMAFDKTLSSVTVEHHRACDADSIKTAHRSSCDARYVANASRDASNSEPTSIAQGKKVANVFLFIGIIFFVIAVITMIATGTSDSGVPLIFFGGICMFIQGIIRKNNHK